MKSFLANATAAIRLYQRYISPRKGFGCAYRINLGGASCSNYAIRALRRHGVRVGFIATLRRFARCAQAYEKPPKARMNSQAGAVDFACIGCAPGCPCPCLFSSSWFTKLLR